jgi:hypothetical protein
VSASLEIGIMLNTSITFLARVSLSILLIASCAQRPTIVGQSGYLSYDELMIDEAHHQIGPFEIVFGEPSEVLNVGRVWDGPISIKNKQHGGDCQIQDVSLYTRVLLVDEKLLLVFSYSGSENFIAAYDVASCEASPLVF